MRKLSRHMLLIPAALLLGLIFTIVLDAPAPVCATCGSTMHAVRSKHTDRQTSDTKNGVTTNTEQINVVSVVVGDQGDVFTENSSYNKNSDGSSESHENMHAEDPEGCDEDGEPWKGNVSIDNTSDPKGNRKRHQEEFFEKNGKCIKTTRDWEWNAKGELIKDTNWVETEVPCPTGYSLEVSVEGHTPSTGDIVPKKLLIPLARKGDIYTGTYQGELEFVGSVGDCTAEAIYQESYDVTAQPDEFGVLQFTILHTLGLANGSTTCPSEGTRIWSAYPSEEFTENFPLEADGSPYRTSIGDGEITWSYTLREQNKP